MVGFPGGSVDGGGGRRVNENVLFSRGVNVVGGRGIRRVNEDVVVVGGK